MPTQDGDLAAGQLSPGLAPRQFNWRRHWRTKVAPHLDKELVQSCLDLGMRMLDPKWKRGDPPHILGRLEGRRVMPGKLEWYRPHGRCHWIAFFSMAIGVLNYPHLDWRFVSGDLHTVPVGFDQAGQPKVVMDILLFDRMTAKQSLALTRKVVRPGDDGWAGCFEYFVSLLVPLLRAAALDRFPEKPR